MYPKVMPKNQASNHPEKTRPFKQIVFFFQNERTKNMWFRRPKIFPLKLCVWHIGFWLCYEQGLCEAWNALAIPPVACLIWRNESQLNGDMLPDHLVDYALVFPSPRLLLLRVLRGCSWPHLLVCLFFVFLILQFFPN